MRRLERDDNDSERHAGYHEEREAEFQALKDHVQGAIRRGGAFTDGDLATALAAARNRNRESS